MLDYINYLKIFKYHEYLYIYTITLKCSYVKIQFKPIGGATFILSIGELKIAVDPVLCKKGTIQDYFWFKSERIQAPVFNESDFIDVDLWLITHNHEDHLDESGLSVMSSGSVVVSNMNSVKKLSQKKFEQLVILRHKQSRTIQLKAYTIKIEAIPAIHGINPLSALFAGRVNAYYLQISNERENVSIYITSDTVYKKRIIRYLKDRKIDVLIPNMGAAMQGTWVMTLTLNAEMLKKIISEFNPMHVLPVHFESFKHYYEPIEKVKELMDDRIKIIDAGSTKTIFISN